MMNPPLETPDALSALSALAQETRLAVFRLLVETGPAGLAAGEIATTLAVRPNTLSAALNVLVRAGLIRNTREGRIIRYFARMERMQGLLGFLMQDCCGGRPELCAPALAEITCCSGEKS